MSPIRFKSVATRIESPCRHEDLSFKHHTIVAPLPPEQQKEFLQKASDELEEITGYSRATIKTMKHVASIVAPEQRLEGLSFKHHTVVAPLPPEQQKEFLQKASDDLQEIRVAQN